MTQRRPGRPRAGSAPDGGRREALLLAARSEFSAKGFRGASLRAIARAAGVDVALIAHYFGNKEGLYAATFELVDRAKATVRAALLRPASERAEALTRAYLGLWEDESVGPQIRALTRSALGDDAALRGIEQALLSGFDTLADVADVTALAFAMSQLFGVAIQRHLLPGSPIARLDFDAVVDHAAPAVALHLDGHAPRQEAQ